MTNCSTPEPGGVRDWFSHTAHCSTAECAPVNIDLAAYVETVRDHAHTHLGEGVSVAVSGSLARGEPALRRRGGGVALGSDVDLVAVVDRASTTQACVEKFLRSVLEQRPDIDTTVFIVNRADLARVAGRFGADLHHARAHTMAGPALEGVACPRVGKREGLEGLTHQLATIYCPDSPPGASPWRTKTVLEALRAVAADNSTGPQHYSALIGAAPVRELFDRDTVEKLVRAREFSAPLPISTAHAYDLVMTAACALFGVADEREPLAALHACRPGAHLLDGFQHAVIAATIILYGPPRRRCSAAAALHVIAAAIDPDTLPTARPALEALRRISPAEFGRGIEHPNRVLRQHLQSLRRDYYRWVGPHNSGAHPVPDYHGPTMIRRPAHG